MGETGRTRHDLDHRQKIAAQRQAAMRVQRRNRLLLAFGAITTVIVVTVAIVLVKTLSPAAPAAPAVPASGGLTGTALDTTVRNLTTVPASVLDAVAGGPLATADIGSATAVGEGYLAPVSGAPLTTGGKPEVLYVGAEFCPYCAAVRWPLIVALSRFGAFAGLSATRSGVSDGAGGQEPYPATATWTFHGSSYTSRYLSFSAVEMYTSIPDPATGGYTVLDTPTAAELATLEKYGSGNGIPFLDIGNAYVQLSTLSPYGPQALQGATWSQVTAAIRDPASPLGGQIDASANYLTAAICKLTANQPASACTPAVRALQARLGS